MCCLCLLLQAVLLQSLAFPLDTLRPCRGPIPRMDNQMTIWSPCQCFSQLNTRLKTALLTS